MPIKSEWRVPVYSEGNIRSLHKLRFIDIGAGKSDRKCLVVKGIEHQLEKREDSKVIKEDGGVLSPISMTMLKQGLVKGGINCSNVYKTVEKQGLEGGTGNCANAPKTIGKTVFEEKGLPPVHINER